MLYVYRGNVCLSSWCWVFIKHIAIENMLELKKESMITVSAYFQSDIIFYVKAIWIIKELKFFKCKKIEFMTLKNLIQRIMTNVS